MSKKKKTNKSVIRKEKIRAEKKKRKQNFLDEHKGRSKYAVKKQAQRREVYKPESPFRKEEK